MLSFTHMEENNQGTIKYGISFEEGSSKIAEEKGLQTGSETSAPSQRSKDLWTAPQTQSR